jgi:hypothetical protein
MMALNASLQPRAQLHQYGPDKFPCIADGRRNLLAGAEQR